MTMKFELGRPTSLKTSDEPRYSGHGWFLQRLGDSDWPGTTSSFSRWGQGLLVSREISSNCFHDLWNPSMFFLVGTWNGRMCCLDSGFEIMIYDFNCWPWNFVHCKMCVLLSLQIDAGCRQAPLAGKEDMNWCGCWCLVVVEWESIFGEG